MPHIRMAVSTVIIAIFIIILEAAFLFIFIEPCLSGDCHIRC